MTRAVTREQYVRPPLVAAEPPSRRLAAWRYRVVAVLVLLLALVLLVWVFLRFSGVTNGEDPGLDVMGALVSRAAAR